MKVVKETKRASVKQMEAMANNLSIKLGFHTDITIGTDAYVTGSRKTEYGIYTQNTHWSCNTWKELQDYYKKLIST